MCLSNLTGCVSTHIHTSGNLESPVNLTCMCLDCGSKLEGTHTSTGRTFKLCTDKLELTILDSRKSLAETGLQCLRPSVYQTG
ncbi:hypothetical protein EXN66_Car022531 [Channa argus]|nr:hypothetical protein EXN66_Car022531 [Channa argus]